MNVVPAQLAGVPSLAVASPPQADHGGWPHPTILAACALLGVDEVWAMGGAQAVAAFAYGIDDGDDVCEPVSLVTGPGNIYVAAAKRLLKGVIGIDAEAGPTEIAVLADDSADAEHVASDLVSQAEHDPLAAAVLVTDSPELADAVEAALVRRVAGDQAHRAGGRGAGRHPVGDRARRRPRRRARPGQRLRRRAPRDPDPRRRGGRRAGCATPARSSSAPGRR